MGELVRLNGIRICMYPEKNSPHHVPHVHIYTSNKSCVMNLEGVILKGELSNHDAQLAKSWVQEHAKTLIIRWVFMISQQI